MAITYESIRTHLLPIYILGVDINKVQEPVDRPNGYPSYQLSLCVDGSGIYIDENNKNTLFQKEIYFSFHRTRRIDTKPLPTNGNFRT